MSLFKHFIRVYTREFFPSVSDCRDNLSKKDQKMTKTDAATEGMSHGELCVSLPKVWRIYMRKWGGAGIGQSYYDGKKKKRQIKSVSLHRRGDEATKESSWKSNSISISSINNESTEMAPPDGC